jgi:hypothetical protein
LRRRRRQLTQIIRKKSTSDSSSGSYYPVSQKSGTGKKLFFYFLAIIILAFISYYLYNLNFLEVKTISGDRNSGQVDSLYSDHEQVESVTNDKGAAPFEHKIQVEILNGCGINGIAKIFKKYLQDQGFDVVNTENYVVDGKVNWTVEKSFIIDQIGVKEQAKIVAQSLSIPAEKIINRTNPQAIYDVSVVIGKDYKNLIKQ